jgi:deoxyribodipyrimidine photo-lyase
MGPCGRLTAAVTCAAACGAASTGCDAQPYFRIFNPGTQSEKFDPQGKLNWQFVLELTSLPDCHIHAPWKMSAAKQRDCGVLIGRDYPARIGNHAIARKAALDLYQRTCRGKPLEPDA